ncbi:MAG: response regulator [Verrucomicrobiota bacterium]
MKALLIDENSAHMEAVDLLLRCQGIETVSASGIDDALNILASKSIHLIISAIAFPGKTAVDLCCALKVNPVLAKIPLIFTVSEADHAETREALAKAGAHHFLQKPVSPEILIPMLRRIFPNQRIFLKERNLIMTEAELDKKTMLQLLDEFLEILKALGLAVEMRTTKAALHSHFAQAQSYAQMFGTGELSSMFEHYMHVSSMDPIELKNDFDALELEIENMKTVLVKGEKVDEEKKEKGDQAKVQHLSMQDFSLEMARILKEAQEGSVDQQYEVAMCYLMGMPELRNIEEGKKWLQKAAEHKNPHAICQRALMALGDQPILGRQEIQEALEQMELSLKCGSSGEAEFWKKNLLQGIDTLTELEKSGQTELKCPHTGTDKPICPIGAQHGIICLFHAYKGDPQCQFFLGELYERGQRFPPAIMIATYWLMLAAEKEHIEAMYSLGMLFQQHLTGYTGEDERAFQCFDKAASCSHVQAQFCLGKLFHNGVGTEINLGRARYWYERAANQKHSHAQYWLGVVLEETNTDPTDLREALKWYLISVANGSSMAIDQIPFLEKKLSPHEVEMAHMSATRYLKLSAMNTASGT